MAAFEQTSSLLEKSNIKNQLIVVHSKRKRLALLNFAKYHLAPISVTAFLTVIYALNWVWPGAELETATHAGLQFAAKVHEGLIIMSLSNILFHRLRYLIIGAHGVPLGLLSAPSQLSNPLYLLSPEFSGTFRRSLSRPREFRTVALAALLVVIGASAGPLSATLMVPQPGLWRLSSSNELIRELMNGGEKIAENSPGVHFTDDHAIRELNISTADLYPQSIGPELGVKWSCTGPDRSCTSFFQMDFPFLYDGCVGAERVEIRSQDNSSLLYLNLTGLHTYYSTWSSSELVLATTSTQTLSDALGSTGEASVAMLNSTMSGITMKAFEAADGAKLATKQPVVLLQNCMILFTSRNITPTPEELLSTDKGDLDCSYSEVYPGFNLTMTEALATTLLENDWNYGFVKFVDIQDQLPYPVSAVAIVVPPPVVIDEEYEYFSFICIFHAVWETSGDPYLSGASSVELQVGSGYVNPGSVGDSFLSYFQEPLTSDSELITFDTNWTNNLDVAPLNYDYTGEIPAPGTYQNLSLFQLIATCSLECFTTALPSLLAGTLSAATCSTGVCNSTLTPKAVINVTYEFATSSASTNASKRVTQHVWYYQSGLGYGFQNITILACFAVLYLHVALVLVHTCFIVFGGFWTSAAWSSVGDFVALALRSSAPPENLLQNVGGGVKSKQPWQLTVHVREVTSRRRVELIVSDPENSGGGVGEGNGSADGPETKMLEPDKKYA